MVNATEFSHHLPHLRKFVPYLPERRQYISNLSNCTVKNAGFGDTITIP
jgi:hypothetical protein